MSRELILEDYIGNLSCGIKQLRTGIHCEAKRGKRQRLDYRMVNKDCRKNHWRPIFVHFQMYIDVNGSHYKTWQQSSNSDCGKRLSELRLHCLKRDAKILILGRYNCLLSNSSKKYYWSINCLNEINKNMDYKVYLFNPSKTERKKFKN